MGELLLSMKDITKRFPGVLALNRAQLSVHPGEVVALMGENGAGKSTLMKILLGIHLPDEGEIIFRGEQCHIKSPKEALEKGISMIHQELSLVPSLSVSENIWLGREDRFKRNGFVSARARAAATRELLDFMGVDIAAETECSKLSVATLQLVEVARAVSYNSSIIIMDEPTSALAKSEIQQLFAIIRKLAAQGKGIIFISHKLDEVLEVCDTVFVLRDGCFVESRPIRDLSADELVRLMVGREVQDMYPKLDAAIRETVLEVENLSRTGVFEEISFQVHAGEILGFSGLMGAGRSEIMEAIYGLSKIDRGVIRINGAEVRIDSPQKAIRHGMAMVTEDRLRKGLIHMLSVEFNLVLTYLTEKLRGIFVKKKDCTQPARDMVEALDIKVSDIRGEAGQLSGGNQQKVIFGKWMLVEPSILILDEPTRGIDVGSKAEIYKMIGRLAQQGKAIIVVSSELPEVMGISDRIVVISKGRISGEFDRAHFDENEIMSCAFSLKNANSQQEGMGR